MTSTTDRVIENAYLVLTAWAHGPEHVHDALPRMFKSLRDLDETRYFQAFKEGTTTVPERTP